MGEFPPRDISTDGQVLQSFLIVRIGHSCHEPVKQILISGKVIWRLAVLVACLIFVAVGLAAGFINAAWRVIQYNQLRATEMQLQRNYEELLHQFSQHADAVTTLEALPIELSNAYGLAVRHPLGAEWQDAESFASSVNLYRLLKSGPRTLFKENNWNTWQYANKPTLWPVNGTLTSGFGVRVDPFSGEGGYHTGVDIAAPKGTAVLVTANGIVSRAGWRTGYGKLIIVDHGGGIETYYAHLSQIQVIVGQNLSCGDIIGSVGETGHSTGPHLHYEVRIRERPVDPYPYLVKLVPLTQTARTDLTF